MKCNQCNFDMAWKEVKNGIFSMVCTCGYKTFFNRDYHKKYLGHMLYTRGEVSWTLDELRKLDKAVEHYCDDICFFKGKQIYTYWLKDGIVILGKREPYFNRCSSFRQLINSLSYT